ncbi:MAG: patatin-like phospholipase family protein [Thermoanaerobacteraceae bacterium]
MRPKIGLILGGGAARGYAHLGVLKKLKDEGITIDFIIGASMGALVGAAYSSKENLDDLLNGAHEFGFFKFLTTMDIKVSRKGLIRGTKLEKHLEKFIKKDFNELYIPMYIVATDVNTGKEIIFKEGDLIKAVRASISIPFVFEPVEWFNTELIDGSIVEFDVAFLAESLGADIIIISDVSSNIDMGMFTKIFSAINKKTKITDKAYKLNMLMPDMMSVTATTMKLLKENKEKKITTRCSKPIYTIKSDVDNIKWYRFDKAEETIKKGEEAAKNIIQEIKKISKI